MKEFPRNDRPRMTLIWRIRTGSRSEMHVTTQKANFLALYPTR
jgi:hypothetical protein